MTRIAFQEPTVSVKHQLAALWTSVMFCYVYGDYFELYAPDKVAGLLRGDTLLDSPLRLFLASALMTVPALMISGSVLLTASVSRVLNVIFGTLFTLIMLLIAATSIIPWYGFYVFLAIVESFLTILIVWYAWTWPRKTTNLL